MLSTYRYAKGRRGWLEAQREGGLLTSPQGPPDSQDTDALGPHPTRLTCLCPKEVTPVRSPVGVVPEQHRVRRSWEPLQQANKGVWWTRRKSQNETGPELLLEGEPQA